MAYTFTRTGAQIEDIHNTVDNIYNTLGNSNLLSNHNFLIQTPDDSRPLPSATPTSYPPGYQIFSGVFANETTGITNLTYVDGRVSFSGGDFYMPVSNTGAIARLDSSQLVASVADFDGKPRTRGVSFALAGDEYRVTVGVDSLEDVVGSPTPLGSVKFEQGSAATKHDIDGPTARDQLGNPFLLSNGVIDEFVLFGGKKQSSSWADPSLQSQGRMRIHKIKDRIFVDDAVVGSGSYVGGGIRSWLGNEANGLMGYYDTRSSSEVISSIGGIAHAAGSRTSDNDRDGERSAIAYAAYTTNDNDDPLQTKSNWSYYGQSVRVTDNTRATFSAEFNVANAATTVVETQPYDMGPQGLTVCVRARTGGETEESGIPVIDSSAAYDIARYAPDGSKFLKGLVVQNGALREDSNGESVLIETPTGAGWRWRWDNIDGNIGGNITCTNSSSKEDAAWLTFTSSGLELGKYSDRGQLRYNPTVKALFPVDDGGVTLGLASREFTAVNSKGYQTEGFAGVSGNFTTNDGKTVTVRNGLITSIA